MNFDDLWRKTQIASETPIWIYPNDDALAVFCVCGFLRWGAEESYTSEDWAAECDIYLLVQPS